MMVNIFGPKVHSVEATGACLLNNVITQCGTKKIIKNYLKTKKVSVCEV